MKVVNVVQDFNTGGIQKLLLEYLRYFKAEPELDYTVVVLECPRDSAFDRMAREEGLNVVYLNCAPSNNNHYFIRKISDWLCYNGRLLRYLRKHRPDVVHTHNTRILKRIKHGIRLYKNRTVWFHTLHSDPFAVHEFHVPVAKKMFRFMHPICLNETQFRKAAQRYDLRRCDYLYNIIDIPKYRDVVCSRETVLQELGIPLDAYVIGTVGRMEPVKNYGFLLDAFEIAAKKSDRAVLLFVGDGSQRQALEKLAIEKGLAERVFFAGVRTDAQRLYRGMDVFALTSETESSPLVVIEAQAAGRTCVVAASCPDESICTPKVVKMAADATPEQWSEELLHPTAFRHPAAKLDQYSIEQNTKKLMELYARYAGAQKTGI